MSKYCDDSNKLVIAKMKDKTSNVAIEEFIGLKPKMYLFLVHDNKEYKKVIMNIKRYCCIINVWEIQWVEFKVKTIE